MFILYTEGCIYNENQSNQVKLTIFKNRFLHTSVWLKNMKLQLPEFKSQSKSAWKKLFYLIYISLMLNVYEIDDHIFSVDQSNSAITST